VLYKCNVIHYSFLVFLYWTLHVRSIYCNRMLKYNNKNCQKISVESWQKNKERSIVKNGLQLDESTDASNCTKLLFLVSMCIRIKSKKNFSFANL
jgi:hypothetical protein